MQLNLLGSINYFAVMYVMYIDSKMLNRYGLTGLFIADAALISLGVLLLAGFCLVCRTLGSTAER